MKTCLHKNLYMNVHSSIIYSSQKAGTTKCPSTGKWKLNVASPHNRILFDTKKEQSTDTGNTMDETQKHVRWKKPKAKDHVLSDSIYMECPEKAEMIESRLVVAWGLGWGWGVTTNGHQGSFWGDGKVLKLDCCNVCTTENLPKIIEKVKNHYT